MSTTSYQNIDNNLHSDSLEIVETQVAQPKSNFSINRSLLQFSALTFLVVIGIIGYSFSNSSRNGLNNFPNSLNLMSQSNSFKQKFSMLRDEEKAKLFEEFKNSFQKSYESVEEESKRFDNFMKNLNLADIRNSISTTSLHGINALSDLSEEEFLLKLGYKESKDMKLTYVSKTKTIDDYQNKLKNLDGSGLISWVGKYTTAIKDQGDCGSCWAFSTASQIESDSIRMGILSTSDDLSAEQIVDCDTSSYGCNGGTTESAYFYVYSNGGIESSQDYPYAISTYSSGLATQCSANPLNNQVTISNYYLMDSEESMKAHVTTTGPLSVCLDASNWLTYVGGVMSSSECGSNVDHCVQVVGINLDENYWIVRNSWGTSWGQGGFIYLQYGENACDITNDPTYVDPVKL